MSPSARVGTTRHTRGVRRASRLLGRDADDAELSVAIAAVLNLMGDPSSSPRQGLLGAAVATAASQYAAALLILS